MRALTDSGTVSVSTGGVLTDGGSLTVSSGGTLTDGGTVTVSSGGSHTSTGIIGPVPISPGAPAPGGLGDALGASSMAGNSGLAGLSGIQTQPGVDGSFDQTLDQLDSAIGDADLRGVLSRAADIVASPVDLSVFE